ncbi:MAG TPA: amidohydrolase, partial [Leeuwenhoekiella sp.]|nr:amidohydrolase [Leeuwenhoekiella sp.]
MVSGQEYFPVNDGVKSINTNYTLFKNATLHPSPGKTISSGSLLIKDGKIVSAGKSVNAPKNAVVIDLEGKHIYPSFVETYSSFGVKIPERSFGGRSPQYEATRAGYYWNDHVRAETNALNEFEYDNKAAKALVEAGFGTVSTHMADGLARGNGILVALNSDGNTAERLLDTRSAQFFSFEKSNLSQQSYPSSIMGSTALIRQMFEDADWYEAGNIDTRDLSLEALNANMDLPQIFYGDGLYDDLRIASLSQETGVPFIIVGGGDEYKRIDEIKATGAQYIIPVNFQDAYDVEDPYQASFVSLSQMLEWNQEPTNPAKLQEAGLTFAITTNDLKSPDMLFPMLRKAFKYGLDEETALAALTTIPAQLLGKSEELGTLNQNAWANFLITSGPIFDEETILYENWVQGAQNIVKDASVIDIDGSYTLTTAGKSYDVTISKSTEKPSVTVKDGETKLGSKIAYTDGWLNITFTGDADKKEYTRIIAQASNTTPWNGKAILLDGSESTFSISKKASTEEEEEKEE